MAVSWLRERSESLIPNKPFTLIVHWPNSTGRISVIRPGNTEPKVAFVLQKAHWQNAPAKAQNGDPIIPDLAGCLTGDYQINALGLLVDSHATGFSGWATVDRRREWRATCPCHH